MEDNTIATFLSLNLLLNEEKVEFPDVKLSNWNIWEH